MILSALGPLRDPHGFAKMRHDKQGMGLHLSPSMFAGVPMWDYPIIEAPPSHEGVVRLVWGTRGGVVANRQRLPRVGCEHPMPCAYVHQSTMTW